MANTRMTVLAGRAFSLVGRRLPLYGAVGALVLGVQAVMCALRVPNALLLANFLVDPIFVTIVYAFVFADATGTDQNPWARVLERLWAVIVIDFLTTWLQIFSLGYGAVGDVLGIVVSIALGLLFALLILADVSAVVDDEHDWLLLIPRSFARSVSLATRSDNLRRVIILYALQIVLDALAFGLQVVLDRHHVAFSDFWANVPLFTVATPPLAALTTLVYMDASGMLQPERSCDG